MTRPRLIGLALLAVVGTVLVSDCLLLTAQTRALLDPEDPAVRFGLAQPGCWVWACNDPDAFPKPVPMPGRLGIYSIPYPLPADDRP